MQKKIIIFNIDVIEMSLLFGKRGQLLLLDTLLEILLGT